jgi:hypothetical protein
MSGRRIHGSHRLHASTNGRGIVMRTGDRLGALRSSLYGVMLGLSTCVVASDIATANGATFTESIRADSSAPQRESAPKSVQPRGGATAGITVTQSGGTTTATEGGASDSYTIVLQAPPTNDVSVSLMFDASQLVINGSTGGSFDLLFTPGNWSVAQTVTVMAVDDTIVESSHASIIVQSASSADPDYASINPDDVAVSITDNDTAEIIFSSAGFSTIEGAVFSPGATLKVTANGAPGGSVAAPIVADLVLGLGTADATDVSVSGTHTFPAGSAHDTIVTTASVSVADDRLVEGAETFTLSLAIGSGPATTTASNSYQIISDDSASIGFVAASSSTGESLGSALVPVVLTVTGVGTGPAGLGADVDVAILDTAGTATTPADYQLSTASLTFAAGAASGETRNVEVALVGDALIEGNHSLSLGFGSITTSASGVSASGSHVLTLFDDDFAGIDFTESGGNTTVTEGGPGDSFTLGLTAQPTSDVTVTFDVGTQVTFAPNPLVIPPADWNVPQTITVTAVDDVVNEGPHAATVGLIFTGDANFAAITPNSISVTASIVDNDVPGVVVTESDGASSATEGGAGDSYTIRLASAPAADVSIAVDGGAQVGVSVAVLTFTPGNYAVPQSVILSAIDDALVEGPHTGNITHSVTSADAGYDGIAVAPVGVALVDNDVAGVSIVASGGTTTTTEGGAGDGFTLQLTAQPTTDVTISFAVGGQLSFAPNPLVVTPAQWNVPQAVTVTAVDDALAQGPRSIDVGLSFSGDAGFAAIPPGSIAVPVSIADNDSAGILLLQSGGNSQVSEGGAGDSYTLQLQSQPLADVQIAIDGGGQLLVSPTLLTFTAANWNLPQTVSISAINDVQSEGAHAGSVSHAVTSADPAYDGFALAALPVGIGDNDLLVPPTTIPANSVLALLLLVLMIGLGATMALPRRTG